MDQTVFALRGSLGALTCEVIAVGFLLLHCPPRKWRQQFILATLIGALFQPAQPAQLLLSSRVHISFYIFLYLRTHPHLWRLRLSFTQLITLFCANWVRRRAKKYRWDQISVKKSEHPRAEFAEIGALQVWARLVQSFSLDLAYETELLSLCLLRDDVFSPGSSNCESHIFSEHAQPDLKELFIGENVLLVSMISDYKGILRCFGLQSSVFVGFKFGYLH
jgi:hypothetical protein